MKIKKRILRSTALAMAVLLLCVSVGFNVDFHYCSGQLKSFSLIGKAESCHKKKSKPCPFHKGMMIVDDAEKFDCCNNKTVYFQSDQDLQFQFPTAEKDIQFQKSVFAGIALIRVFQENQFIEKFHPPPEPPLPPNRKDITIWHQSFLC